MATRGAVARLVTCEMRLGLTINVRRRRAILEDVVWKS